MIAAPQPIIYKVNRGNVLGYRLVKEGHHTFRYEERAPGKPFYTCEGIACHDRNCSLQSSRCAMALATNMVRAGFADGMMMTPCQTFHCYQSIYRVAECQRSPRLCRSQVDIMRNWIREYGDKHIRLEYMACRRIWNKRYERDYYVSLTEDGARFSFLMLWRYGGRTVPHIMWPDDWQLKD